MGSNLYEYLQVLKELKSYKNIPEDLIRSLRHYTWLAYQSDKQNKFSEPMPLIGMYIALASLFCTLAMVADLLHGLRNRKLWFPCKYFTLNAASLTVIAIAMKLPMDLNNPMPGEVDQASKIGSIAFMCTMMANLLPSLATMDSMELVTNIIALGVFVITLVVNVCIQIKTGIFSTYENEELLEIVEGGDLKDTREFVAGYDQSFLQIMYISMLLMLLIMHTCSSLMILKAKQLLESKYQAAHEIVLKDQQPGRLNVEKLKQHVSNYWVMASTASPQFMTACSATGSASGVICVLSTSFYILSILTLRSRGDYKSDYKQSTLMILVIQFVGALMGTIAPFSRCFAALSFKLSIKWIWNQIKVFEVESYWTQKLSDWKQSSIPFPFPSNSRKLKIVIQNIKILVLSICIGCQKTAVVAFKMLGLFPIFFVICVLYCFLFWKWLKGMFSASGNVLVKRSDQLEQNKDVSQYVLQLQHDMELAERTVKGILKSMNRSIERAEKQQPTNLMKLLEASKGFEGVVKFDNQQVPPLFSEEFLGCWSLTLVTLTTIVISLPDIQQNILDSLLSSVSEGLVYVTHVEESLNSTNDYVRIQKASRTLWLEVEVYHKWLGNELQSRGSTARQILEWFRDTAKSFVTELECMENGGLSENSIYRTVSANSMYRIAETILLSNQADIDEVSLEELYAQLSSMIADILAACLTNLPQVIAMKCHEKTIEKREASVHAAAQLLGQTTCLMNSLHDRELPGLNPDEMAFIDRWRAYLIHPFP